MRSRQHKKREEKIKDIERGKKSQSLKSAAVSMGKGELRFSSVFLQVFFSAVPRSCQPHTSALPTAWLGSAEYWGINLTSENAPARVKGKLGWAKASSALLARPTIFHFTAL